MQGLWMAEEARIREAVLRATFALDALNGASRVMSGLRRAQGKHNTRCSAALIALKAMVCGSDDADRLADRGREAITRWP